MPNRSNANEVDQRMSMWELHGQSFVQLAVLGVAGWIALIVAEMPASQARLEEQVKFLVAQVEELKQQSADRYTVTNATKDWALQRRINEDQSEAIKDLRTRMRALETSE